MESERTSNSQTTTSESIEANSPNKNSLIKSICMLLEEIIVENKSAQTKKVSKISNGNHFCLILEKYRVQIFDSKKPPAITIEAYLERILKYSKIEESTLIISLIYIDRLCDSMQLQLSEFNIHR
jgi:hypothetical protein